MTPLDELIAKVEGASGPDRELDARLWCAVEGYRFDRIEVEAVPYSAATPAFVHFNGATSIRLSLINRMTASLDAALALVEAKRPGCMVALAGPWVWAAHTERAGQPIWCAEVAECTETGDLGRAEVNDLEHKAATPALAICLALLRSLAQQEGETG